PAPAGALPRCTPTAPPPLTPASAARTPRPAWLSGPPPAAPPPHPPPPSSPAPPAPAAPPPPRPGTPPAPHPPPPSPPAPPPRPPLHRPRLPPPRRTLRPGPHHPLGPGRHHLRMRSRSALPAPPQVQTGRRMVPGTARTRCARLAHPLRAQIHFHPNEVS